MKKELRVIYFCPSECLYGDNLALLRIMPFLVQQGIEPYFFIAFEGAMSEEVRRSGYYCHITNENISNMYILDHSFYNWIIALLWRVKRMFKVNSILKNSADIAKKINPDFIHSNSSNSLLGYKLAERLGVQHFWHIREYGDLDCGKSFFPSKDLFIRRIKKEFNNNIFITPLIREHFKSPRNSRVIYDGVVESTARPMLDIHKKKQILFVGRLFEKKGVSMVINAFSKSLAPRYGYKLILAGDGDAPYVNYLKDLVNRLNMRDNVTFLGYVKNVDRIMQESHAQIVASDFEAFGFITAEAMYNGCLVIGRNTAGTKLQMDNVEMVTKNICSLRFNDIDDLIAAINKSLDSELAININEIQSAVCDLYDIEKSAQFVLNYYYAKV